MDRHRGRCRLAALVAAALCLVAAHEGRCGAAARRLHAVEEAVLDVAAAEAPEAARWPGGGDALGEAKWLPMSMPVPVPVQVPASASALAGGLRFPPVVFPLAGASIASMPWLPIPGAPHAFAGAGGGGGLPALVPPYVGATRQEQLSLWASLFNPLQVRPRLPISLGGGDTTAGPGVERGGVPAAIAGVGKAAEGEAVDMPTAGAVQAAQPKWGVFLGNIDHRN